MYASIISGLRDAAFELVADREPAQSVVTQLRDAHRHLLLIEVIGEAM